MHTALALVALTIVVSLVAAASDRFRWPTPLVLVGVGAAVSFLPLVPEVTLEPELVLNGLLPPLLYATTARTSLFDFRSNKLPTVLLSVVLVVFSTVAIGWTTSLLLPGVALAVAMALGAVVAPPDAVAASAIGQRLGLPRRVATMLEEESLVNDATALIALSVAITAITGTVSPVHIVGDFVLAVVGALAVGAVVAVVLSSVRRHIRNPVLDTTVSFVAPYLAFLPAEALHVSGVLAVVVTGLWMAHVSPRVQTASSRIAEATNWRTVAFLLENAVFLLIGLQLPHLLRDSGDSGLGAGRIVVVCVGVLVATIVARFVFVYAAVGVLSAVPAWRGHRWPAGVSLLMSWSGMRGVVTLAAAQLIPEDTEHREVLLLAAFTVVVGTLLVQGSTLPWLIRRVGLPAPDPAEDALAAAEIGDAAAQAGVRRLEELLATTDDVPPHVEEMLRVRSKTRSHAAWERLGRPLSERMTPSAAYASLRMEMLSAERDVVVRARNHGTAEPEVLRAALAAIDFEESLLDHSEELDGLAQDRDLALPTARAGCAHLRSAPAAASGPAPVTCEDCDREGTVWVHLRTCLACGYTGCCDSSERRHARRHFGATAHPVVVSGEPGEAWRWCWVDEELG